MGPKNTVHTFRKGMVKDLETALISKESYFDATNLRPITSKGLSTGSLENIEGNNIMASALTNAATLVVGSKYLVVSGSVTYNSTGYSLGQTFTVVTGVTSFTGTGTVVNLNLVSPDGYYIIGSAEMRGEVVLFQTNNTNSRIVLVTYNETTEKVVTVTVIYDDSDNNSTGTLGFSTSYLIKAVARYETPNIKKVYWTDGLNNIRYIDVAKNNTNDGQPKTGSNYFMSPDLLEFIPRVTLNKPTLANMISGVLKPGMVQYAYQYFRVNGAETLISPLSNTIHITESGDNLSYTLTYIGSSDPDAVTNKGCEVTIPLDDSSKYNKVRIIRFSYSTLNSIPSITIVAELDIDSTMSSVNYKDTGLNIIGELTLDEVSIPSTSLFSCEDIAAKDNILFAANITEDNTFDVDWDARAVRFKRTTTPGPGGTDDTDEDISLYYNGADVNFTYSSDISFNVTITGVLNWFPLPSDRTLVDITDIYSLAASGSDIVTGEYEDTVPSTQSYSSTQAQTSFSSIVYNSGTDTLTFTVTTSGSYFTNFDHFLSGGLEFLRFEYDYDDFTYTISSYLGDTTSPITITEPADLDDPAEWDLAGWDDYTDKHDGINEYNDTDNDFDSTKRYVYQGDGITIGAEGPNIKIAFEYESMVIDESTTATVTYTVPENTATNKSYTNYASPFNSGKRSWQRDEVYRIYVVFFNNRGLASLPKWVCDLRMPSLHDSGDSNRLSYINGTKIETKLLYPKVYFKSFPTGAVSAQILRVRRELADRSILTQGLVVPTTASPYKPDNITANVTAGRPLVKIISPEINITKNITPTSGDYLEFVTDFSTTDSTTSFWTDYKSYRCKANSLLPKTSNERSGVVTADYVIPTKTSYNINGYGYTNYNTDRYGCSGLVVAHDNSSWTTNAVNYCLINYKRNVFDSQYGGNTYNKRLGNVAIPASDIIDSTGSYFECHNGDTFINFMAVSTCLFDLTKTTGNSYQEAVLFPVESSINLDLQHGHMPSKRMLYLDNAQLAQETAGTWTNGSGLVHIQEKSMYQYNTVYSQDSTAKSYINISTENTPETVFDCKIQSSRTKTNGEISDSWTKFPTNDFIEVDPNYGSVKAIANINNKLLYWQDNAFGILSVNDRSLITDGNQSQLVLGTGGVLDRYDYISTAVGTSSKRSVIPSQAAVYWFYDKEKSLYRFADGMENMSKNKLVQSWLSKTITSSYVPHGIYNPRYNEVMFAFYNPSGTSYTLAFNESTDAFTSFYTLSPRMYFPIRHGFLSSYFYSNTDLLFYGNSSIKERCLFNSPIPGGTTDTTIPSTSTLTLVHNEEYPNTKVYDNLFFDTIVTDSNGYEVNEDSFDQIRCYNNYQNTGYVNLVYKTNLERRERTWTTIVPRNAVDVDYPAASTNVLDPANLDSNRLFKERIRDRHMFADFVYNNTSNYRFVIPYVGVRYRISPR